MSEAKSQFKHLKFTSEHAAAIEEVQKARRAELVKEAASRHRWIDDEAVRLLIASGVSTGSEDGGLVFEAPDGSEIPLAEAGDWVARHKPQLLAGNRPKPVRSEYTDEVAYFKASARWHAEQGGSR